MEHLRTAVQVVAALGGVVSVVLYLLTRDPVKRVEHLVAATLAAAILAAVK